MLTKLPPERIEVIGIDGSFAYVYKNGKIAILKPRRSMKGRFKMADLVIVVAYLASLFAVAYAFGLLSVRAM